MCGMLVPSSQGYFAGRDLAGESRSLGLCFAGLSMAQSLPPSLSGPILHEEPYLPQVPIPMMLSPSIAGKLKPDQAWAEHHEPK